MIVTLQVVDNKPAYYGSTFLQVAGARYVFNAGQRQLYKLYICGSWDRDKHVCIGNWEDVSNHPNKLYKVATNDYIRKGGSGFVMLGDASSNLFDVNDDGYELGDLFRQFLHRKVILDPPSMEQITTNCGGFVTNFVEKFKSQPNCRILKAGIEFPERCLKGNVKACREREMENNTPLNLHGLKILRHSNSSCAECSGFGSCDIAAGYKCRCSRSLVEGYDYPRQYSFNKEKTTSNACATASTSQLATSIGIQFSRGEACDEFRAKHSLTGGTKAFAVLCGILCFATSALSTVQILIKYNHVVTQASKPFPNLVMNFGGFLAGIYCVLSIAEPNATLCNLSPTLSSVAIGMVLSGVLVKTQTMSMYRKFRDRGVLPSTNLMNIVVISSVVMSELVICIVLGLQFPLIPTIAEVHDDVQEFSFSIICMAQDEFGQSQEINWIMSILGINILLLFATMGSVYHVMKVHFVFNEIRALSLAMYNATLVCLTTIPLSLFFQDLNLSTLFRILSVTLVIVPVIALLMVNRTGYYNKILSDVELSSILSIVKQSKIVPSAGIYVQDNSAVITSKKTEGNMQSMTIASHVEK